MSTGLHATIRRASQVGKQMRLIESILTTQCYISPMKSIQLARTGLLAAICCFLLSSCTSTRFLQTREHTTSSALAQLKAGNSLDDVRQTLGLDPYSVIFMAGDLHIVQYNYRLTELLLPVMSYAQGVEQMKDFAATVDSPTMMNRGEAQLGDWGVAYLGFEAGALKYILTSDDKMDASDIVLTLTSIENTAENKPFYVIDDEVFAVDENGVMRRISPPVCNEVWFRRWFNNPNNNQQ